MKPRYWNWGTIAGHAVVTVLVLVFFIISVVSLSRPIRFVVSYTIFFVLLNGIVAIVGGIVYAVRTARWNTERRHQEMMTALNNR